MTLRPPLERTLEKSLETDTHAPNEDVLLRCVCVLLLNELLSVCLMDSKKKMSGGVGAFLWWLTGLHHQHHHDPSNPFKVRGFVWKKPFIMDADVETNFVESKVHFYITSGMLTPQPLISFNVCTSTLTLFLLSREFGSFDVHSIDDWGTNQVDLLAPVGRNLLDMRTSGSKT